MTLTAQNFPPQFERALSGVEQALEQVRAHLAQGTVSEMEAACKALQNAMMAWSQMRSQWLKTQSASPQLKLRLEATRVGIAQVRETLARRAAGVQRALQILLPSGSAATYGRGAAAFGSSSKSEASFTSLSA